MVIKNNLVAHNANRQMKNISVVASSSTEKLSSGYRINRAADDAAGLAISEKMRRQIKGLTQASRNAQDGISLVQIADGAMAEISDILHRGTVISVQASNDTMTSQDRKYLQQEITQLVDEIDHIADRTTFNEIELLKGSDPVNIASGGLPAWASFDANTTAAGGYLTKDGDSLVSKLDFSALDKAGADKAALAKDLIGTGFGTTCCTCSNFYSVKFTGGTGNSVEASGQNYIFNVGVEGITSSEDLINRIKAATDGGKPFNHFTEFKSDGAGHLVISDSRSVSSTKISAGGSYGEAKPGVVYEKKGLDIQVGAEAGQVIRIELPAINSGVLGLGADSAGSSVDTSSEYFMRYDEASNSYDKIPNPNYDPSKKDTGGSEASGPLSAIDVTTFKGAQSAIVSFKNANAYVSQERSRMGAYQNRFEHTIKNLDNVVENTTAAESQIRDTDMAKEMVRYSNANIVQQASSAMLAQANQKNQNVVSILG